jgi:metal transporter CNNM
MLEESATADEEEEGMDLSWVWNVLAATICVLIAALAAGLTLGMLGLDPLMLLIKERAAESPVEREQARKLIPIINQHHRLLVTLLLMNAVTNEALPIFLEKMVPPSVAVLLSVTLVLFF